MKKIFLLILLVPLGSCEIELAKINYGKDSCQFCSMNIVDARHAAQLVTDKGKQFKYDAIECMVLDLKRKEDVSIGLLAVGDYSNPGELIDAFQATFLISEEIPSPMGANLSAFVHKDSAEKLIDQHGGKLYSWKEIVEYIEKQNK